MLFRRIPVLHPHAERCVLGDKLVAVVAYRPSPLRQAEAAAAPLLSLKDPQSVLLSADDPSTISYRLHPDCSSTSNPATSWLLLPKKPGKTPPESTSTKYPYSLIYPGDSSGVMAEHLSQSELDYPFKLLEYFNGFRVSKVIFSACELGVFDLLLKSQEPLSAQHVARELSTSVDGMESLLDALVGIEILEVETTDGTAFYSSTDVANLYLAKGSGKSLHDMIVYYSQTIYPLWNNMVDAVRDGKNQNEKTFGLPSEEVFQAIYRSEEEMLKFMGLMNSSWVLDGHDIVTAFNLSCFQTIVDLGGCTGALAREVTKAYPSSSVTVFDLPQIVETAQKHFCQENDAVSFQSGDFFEGEIPPADLYVLARIIHDWPEEKCLTLLKRIYDVCKPGGGVLLVEALLFENRRGPVMAQLFSLNMLVQTEGKERPPSDYTHMLEKTGFSNVQVCRTGKSYDAILAIR